VRKKTHGVETRSHSRCVFGTPAFGGGFVLAVPAELYERLITIEALFYQSPWQYIVLNKPPILCSFSTITTLFDQSLKKI
jgi:hypothetical protein